MIGVPRLLVRTRQLTYNDAMMNLLLATLAGFMIPIAAATPDQGPTYIVRMKDSATVYYGYVKSESADPIEITFDSGPQAGHRQIVSRSKVALPLEQESKTARTERLQRDSAVAQKQLDARGLTQVSPGKYVPKEELEYSNRAKTMVAERKSSVATASEAPADPHGEVSPAPDLAESGATASHGGFKQWGGHIAVGVLGLVLSALVIKTLLL